MKIHKSLVFPLLILVVLASCDHTISMETTVHTDGQLDKVIVFENTDSSKNILGLSESKGWNKAIERKKEESDSVKDRKFITIFKKSFASYEEVNAELAFPNDSLFQITSKFEKKFRWFYTYIYYSETFHSLNRMELKPDDYITPEDYTFIDRLPAEGEKISEADSVYLSALNTRIFDVYGMRAFYEEYFALTSRLIEENKLEQKWIDTLRAHKEDIFDLLESKKDLPEDYMLVLMDSLKIPLDYTKAKTQYDVLFKKLNSKTNFITSASDGKYNNRINLPGPITKTNADSVSGNSLYWTPRSIKFLLNDYTLYGECRELNWWTVIVSVLVIGFTGYLFARKRN